MRTDLSSLTDEMNNLVRSPVSTMTVERWIPDWDSVYGADLNIYAYGHSAIVIDDPASPGNSIVFRARYGTAANPSEDSLFVQVIRGANLDNPAWGTWTASYIGQEFPTPMWTANSGRGYGGGMAVASDNTYFYVFFFSVAQNKILLLSYDLNGASAGGIQTVLTLDSTYYPSMIITAISPTEIYVAHNEQVEPSHAAVWHYPVYGSFLKRVYYNGSAWVTDNSFHHHTHMECGVLRDSIANGANWDSTTDVKLQAQWGHRFTGGIAALKLDEERTLVVIGATFWRRYAYDVHTQGIIGFIHHKNAGLWEPATMQAGMADYIEGIRIQFDTFLTPSVVNGNLILTWNRNTETGDTEQTNLAELLPRLQETVFAKVHSSGKAISQYMYLGHPHDMTGANLGLVKRNGVYKLYAFGYEVVYRSDPAAMIVNDPAPFDLELYVRAYKTRINNSYGMSIDTTLEDASILFQAGTKMINGGLLRVKQGIAGITTQIAQGFVDLTTPNLSVVGTTNAAKLNVRADKQMLDIKSEVIDDRFPQSTTYIGPVTDPVSGIGYSNGYWTIAKGTWDNKHLSDAWGMKDEAVYRLMSFPWAQTGGGPTGTVEDPGKILTERPRHMGTWFKDVAWVVGDAAIDSSIWTSVRFGDVAYATNALNAGKDYIYFKTDSLNFLENRGHIRWDKYRASGSWYDMGTKGIITAIDWDFKDAGLGWLNSWNTPRQFALMGGVICHSREIGKKYSFVWECDSRFDKNVYGGDGCSSHLRDTYSPEIFDATDFSAVGAGFNRLYLVVSDYDENNANWASVANPKWTHKAVAKYDIANIYNVNNPTKLIKPGYPIDMKMQVLGGTIYCYFRRTALKNEEPSPWLLAIQYKAGRFGAGKFGIVGRGHAGIQWDVLYPGKDKIQQFDNYVDFWNVHYSNGVMDFHMEETLRRLAWMGFTNATFRTPLISLYPAGQTLTLNQLVPVTTPIANLIADFDVKFPTSGAGRFTLILRAVKPTTLTNGKHIRISLDMDASGNVQIIKRLYNSDTGAFTSYSTDYHSCPLPIAREQWIPVRVTARGPIYTVWIAGNYIGHFRVDVELGSYFGFHQEIGSMSIRNFYVPELYEMPEYTQLDVGQDISSAIKKVINKRRIKGRWNPDGTLTFSYFELHDAGPTFEDSLVQSSLRNSDRFYSRCRVEGAYTYATAGFPALLQKGERFTVLQMPDIFYVEDCYKEARAYLQESAEQILTAVFTGLPDLRIQPEDQIRVIIEGQSLNKMFLIDEVTITFKMGENPTYEMDMSVRQAYEL